MGKTLLTSILVSEAMVPIKASVTAVVEPLIRLLRIFRASPRLKRHSADKPSAIPVAKPWLTAITPKLACSQAGSDDTIDSILLLPLKAMSFCVNEVSSVFADLSQ